LGDGLDALRKLQTDQLESALACHVTDETERSISEENLALVSHLTRVSKALSLKELPVKTQAVKYALVPVNALSKPKTWFDKTTDTLAIIDVLEREALTDLRDAEELDLDRMKASPRLGDLRVLRALAAEVMQKRKVARTNFASNIKYHRAPIRLCKDELETCDPCGNQPAVRPAPIAPRGRDHRRRTSSTWVRRPSRVPQGDLRFDIRTGATTAVILLEVQWKSGGRKVLHKQVTSN
jgi:hypothetical protein